MQPDMTPEEQERWTGYYRALREWAEYLVGPRLRRRLDESDLAQEAWIAAWEGREQFNGCTAQEWEAWLRGILRNKLANALRWHSAQRRGLQQEVAIPDRVDQSWANVDAMFFGKGPGPLQQLERDERMAQFIEAVAGLTAKEQAVIRLRLFEEWKLIDIARKLDESEGSIAGRVARATRKLQERLGKPEQQA